MSAHSLPYPHMGTGGVVVQGNANVSNLINNNNRQDRKNSHQQRYLHDSLSKPYDQENIVFVDSSEHISFLEHSCIDFIKQLHKHKCCEHDRSVLGWHAKCVRMEAIYNVKQIIPLENQQKHNNQLVDTVTNHIAKQGTGD